MRKSRFLGRNVAVVVASFVCLATFSFPALAETQGQVVIFNAGSLSIPLKDMAAAFNQQYPQVEVLREAAGSRICARKIIDLKRPCDIMASADYEVIDTLLIPKYASWDIHFATNQMAIMYRPVSKYAKEINSNNWYQILLKEGVRYGHSGSKHPIRRAIGLCSSGNWPKSIIKRRVFIKTSWPTVPPRTCAPKRRT